VLPDRRPGACTPANHQQQPTLLLAYWQSAAPVVPSLAELIALPAHHARVASFGVQQPCSRPGAWHTVDPAGHEDAVGARPCFQTVTQAHAHPPITNDSLSCSCPVARVRLRSYHRALDGLSCPLVMRVVRRLTCSNHPHDPARGTPLTLLVTGVLDVLVTIIDLVRNERDNF
jgi:hypothetical protein